jgi:hypothetical protein
MDGIHCAHDLAAHSSNYKWHHFTSVAALAQRQPVPRRRVSILPPNLVAAISCRHLEIYHRCNTCTTVKCTYVTSRDISINGIERSLRAPDNCASLHVISRRYVQVNITRQTC